MVVVCVKAEGKNFSGQNLPTTSELSVFCFAVRPLSEDLPADNQKLMIAYWFELPVIDLGASDKSLQGLRKALKQFWDDPLTINLRVLTIIDNLCRPESTELRTVNLLICFHMDGVM